ncbi:PREDICTED: uncharacterized protein LOC108774246 [Cyphomyrmex costatus]|uniref:uncharacterized protein LOC108774246 n=1 Tax=Cyphomyrmex costatus TaxID=456900 RepID=UPI0008523C72|nr:PREDICTED: uncharacterized protein LOC108774246 [Cyphomyrmex costatus]
MNVKRLLKIDIVYVFHCCALADLPRWIKQSLQQRVEDWKQRSKTLVDQIHEVDPYYVPTNEYRFIGQASYADIAAGRTNSPSSRNCSPYRHQREVTPPTMTAQVLRPMQAQKLIMEHPPSLDEVQISKAQIQKNDTNINKSKSQLQTETLVQITDDQNTVGAEEYQQAVPEVESPMPRRGRSPTRKTNSFRVKDSKIIADQQGEINKRDNLGLGANSGQEMQTESVKNTLAPCEERRGRSPSPMWVPGSTSYADILRGCIQTTQVNTVPAQLPRQKMISLSEESRRGQMEVPRVEQVTEQDTANTEKSQQVTEVQQIVPTQEIQAENMQIAETYCQPEISTEKTEDQNYTESEPTNWTDESLQDYDVMQHVKSYKNVPRQQQPTEIYDYMIPETMPELVGFIGSHLGTYPVSSYVYAPSGHHQQVQQLDQISLNPYDNSSLAYAPEHYVAQTTYLSASEIYQQNQMQQPVDDMRHTTTIVMEKPVEVSVVRQSEVPKDMSATEPIDKPEQQKSVNISNVETSTMNKTEERNTSSLNNMETKGQTFSYAQILSHGLSPRVTSTRIVSESAAVNYQSKERSDSPKESLELSSRELSPLQEPKSKQESQSFAVTSEQLKQFKENDWDTMKKREVRKRQQHPNDKIKQTDERKSRKSIDKSKEKQKNEKLTPPKQLETQDESFLDKINDNPMQKEEKPVQQEESAVDLDTNPSQEKKRRQKKKKIDKSVGDEIDKALKEIENMDKQKMKFQKDKLKEQNKEIKSRDFVNEMIEKHNDEVDKKQSKSGEKSKKSRKSKEVTRTRETVSMEHAILPKDKKDTKDAKVTDSKDEEVQKDITKEIEKNKIKSNELKLEAEESNIDQEKLEISTKEVIENKTLKSIKSLTDIEIKDFESKKLDITKIASDVNESKKEKHDVPISEQMIDEAKMAEAAVVKTSKEILLPKRHQQITQEIVQNDKTCDSAEIKENKETEHHLNAKLEVESLTTKNVEIDTMGEKEAINNNNTKIIEKTKRQGIEKCQTKTTKQKKSEKVKSNIQDKRKENETVIPEQFSEKTNLAQQHVSVLNNSCLVQSKTDPENNHSVKIDEGEDIVLGQVNKSTEKFTTVPETDLSISTVSETVEISTTETLPKKSEVSSEINNTISDMKEKYQNIKNGKLDHHKGTIIKNEDIKTDINDKNSLLKEQDIQKLKDVAPKEKMSKRIKKKERLSPKHTAEQTKQSFYDKFQEEIVFKDDSTKKEEIPRLTNLSLLAKIDNVDVENTQESSKKNKAEIESDSKASNDSVNKAQVYKKHTDDDNNLESEQPSPTGKALIIEKMITTVTTTTSVPRSVKVKPLDVKSVKSVEIIENIPLPKIVGSKVTELITLRPETVEASLTTTYARVPNDSLVDVQSDQAAISQKIGLTSPTSTENIVIFDEMALFGSVRDRRRVCSSTSESRDMSKKSPPMTPPEEKKGEVIAQLNSKEKLGNQLKVEVLEEKQKNDNKKENTEKVDKKTEFVMECESECTIKKIKSEEISGSSKIKTKIVPEYLLDLIKPYAMDRHAYNHAESNFHRYFKVVKVVKKVQPTVTVHTRPESIERIVQDSVMKPIDIKSSNQEMNKSNFRKRALIVEAPKYPITSFYEFESQWIKMKFMPEKSVSVSSDDSEISVKTAIEREKQVVDKKEEANIMSDSTNDTIAIIKKLEATETKDNKDKKPKDLQQSIHLISDDSWMKVKEIPAKVSSVHLESDDAWMALLEEEIIIDDDFDELETETIKDNQIKKGEKDDEIKEAKTEQQIEEKETKTEKSVIEKQEDKKSAIEKHEEIEAKEQKTEILNGTSLTEIAVKDEYHIDIKNIQNETAMDEKQSDKTKNQPRRKKESKHVKVKTKDQAKIKIASKQSEDIKIDISKDDLSLQNNSEEERKLENESDCKTKEAEKSLIVDKEQTESQRDKVKSKLSSDESVSKPNLQDTIKEECEKSLSKREERKSKSNKKSKKQNQKSEVILKEQIATAKCEGNINKDDSIVLSKATKLESYVFEASPIVENQQELKDDVPKYDKQLNQNAKSWAAIVSTRGTTETTVASKHDFSNTQTAVITQDTNDNVTNVVKQSQTPTEYDSCEISSKEETLTMHLPSLENQISKNVIEELKATMVDEIKSIEEKSTEPLKHIKEGNKSYAQVTASSQRTSLQISQEETYLVKSIPLKTDHLAINVKTPISDETHEDFITEKLQSPLEEDNKQDKTVVQSSDYQTVITNLISQEESIPWVKEVEKEAMVISDNLNNTKDNETYVKPENTWAAIVGKKSVESPEVNDTNNLDPSLPKSEQNIELPMQVQIYVEEAPKQEPIENLVQVDEQDIKAKEEIENQIKQSVKKAEHEQKTVNESGDLTKIIKEENAESSNSKDKDKQENDSNENKMQFAENKSHIENKVVQGTKSEPSTALKGKKMKSKNKVGKDHMKQQSEVNEHKELKHIEKPKEDKKSANENKTEHNKIQLENIKDQSVKGTELIKDTQHAQENKCKNVTALPITGQDNTTKSIKKKNKKGKLVIEQLSESISDIDKKTVIAGDLEKKIELPVEPKLDEVKAITTDITYNVLTHPESEETPEEIKKQENIKQVISTENETIEKESIEQKMIVDESKNETHLEQIEANITEEKEIPKFTKAEKRKQKKKLKITQSKFTDSSEDISTVKNIKIKEITSSKDKVDDGSIIEIQSAQEEDIEKPLKKFETVIENKTSFPHITLPKDKQKIKKKLDDILKLRDITINNDIIKIESVSISDKINNSVDEIGMETPVNSVCDSVNAVIKHSLPSDKLSLTVQQSFEDEDKLKCIASIEQENSDILVDEPSKSKVQFYIADEILVLNPDRRKHDHPSTSFLQEQSTTDLCNSWFLSIDDGFWPDKRPYHEAERDHFENLALRRKKNLSRDNKRDSNDRPQDRDDDNSGGGGGGSRSWDSCGNSCSFLGTPQTERMIADLPGGICSWSDYSTYISSESERTMDHNLLLGTIEDPTLQSSLSVDNSLPNEVQSSPEFQSSSPPSQDPQTESRMESLANEITPREYPIVSSSNSFQSSDHPNTCTESSTLVHLPQSKLHLGKETREGSVQRCSPNGEVERETAKGEAERIRKIQDVEEGLASLQARLSNLEGMMSYLPRDSIESMLSSLMTILMELRTYDKDATQLQKRLQEIPADIESQKLSVALTGIQTRVTSLLDQAEKGRITLEQARESREKRGQEIHTYKLFLEETDAWLRSIVSKLHEQHSVNTSKALQEELTSRAHQVSELESLPEVSALAIALKEALLDVIDRLQRKQQEICDEEAQADDESTERDNATLDEAPSIHSSIEGGPPSLADVSLQTGQSLLIDDVVERKAQLTKQTSTTQMPPSTTCHSLTTQTSQDLLPSETAQTQEAIKVLKTTTGDHDVIEIATKYVPSSSSQEIARREQSSILSSEDIVVDMKYQDAKKTDSATSELNIVHAAPQSFETILVEPDDITTEIVVDADGTKRIIVRKLRRTTVTSRQTTQQQVSTLSTAVGETPTMMQAFSEAAMRDQQVTMTRTKPDGTIETTTRQIYGGKVTTSAPIEGINVEEYESEPRYTRMVTQGQIGDISCQPVEEEILMEGGEYQTKTSSVHAVVQQVTRRVIKRTRKIIRKVTIVDGKEITTEEVTEEPEEVEIDEQDIPHISINVVKSEDQKTFPVEKAIEATTSEMSMGPYISETPMQGPFFGPFAKDITSVSRDKAEITKTPVTLAEKDDILETKTLDTENYKKETTLLEEPTIKITDSTTDTTYSKITDSTQTVLSSLKEHGTQVENLANIQAGEDISTVKSDENVAQTEIKSQIMDKQENKHFPTEVNGTSTLASDNQALIDAERSAVLQTPVEDVTTLQSESVKSPLEPAVTDDEPVVTKATCKSDDAPVKSETLSIELENGTVEVETHNGDSSTVEADKNIDVLNVVVLEKEYDKKEESEKEVSLESSKEITTLTPFQKLELGNGSIALTSKLDISESDKNAEETTLKLKNAETSSKERQISPEFTSEEKDDSRDEAFKPEYKPMFHKVEISLSVRKEDEEVEPLVSIKTQAERPEIAPYSIVKEDVDINLPADKETTEVIHDKIVQTTAFLTAEKETETLQLCTAEKEVDVHIESPEKSKSDTTSHKSRKKKRHKDKSESSEKPEETESSTSIATSIAESMEINIPLSDSSKHASEQPQPDVADIIKSESSLSLDDSIVAENDGYQPDDKTMDELSIAPEDEDAVKKKRKKKKKQKVRLIRDEDLTYIPKTSSDDATFTDNSFPLEMPEVKEVTAKDKTKEDTTKPEETKETEIEIQQESKRKTTLDDANTQTTVETCDVSTSLTPKEESLSTFMQTSPEPIPITLEEEIQTAKAEETHMETQTFLEPGLDFSAQTIVEETPEVEDSGVQTMTPTVTPMEEFAIQTSPIEDIIFATVETEDSQAQTTEIDVHSTEMQTSPVEFSPMIATETQTAINTVTEVEQQTTPPPVAEKIIVQEISIQTSSEVPEFFERDMQTSTPISPEQPDVSHTDTQTIAEPEVPAETTETQTTPEESPRKVELQESEMQTKSPEQTKETMMQTSPTIVSPEPTQVCEESVQTSIEYTKQTTEGESQTSEICLTKTDTSDSSVQIQAEELILKIEESIQNIPEVCEISAQTSPKEEKQPTETISVSQQTTHIPTHTVEVSTEDLNTGIIEDLSEVPVSIMLEEMKKEEKMIDLEKTPAAHDVQVPEIVKSVEEAEIVNKLISEIPTMVSENIVQMKVPVEKETKREFSEISMMVEHPKPKTIAKTKESTPSSISEKDTTSDTSYEIHVHATIELSASDTLDSVASGSKEMTDTSQDTTIAEDLNDIIVEHNNKASKRQKRKRKHKTMEITVPSKNEPELESTFRQSEYPSQITSQIESDVKLEDIASKTVMEKINLREENSQETPSDFPTISEVVPISMSDSFVIDSNYIPETKVPEAVTMRKTFMPGRPMVEPLLMSSDEQKPFTSMQLSPEPMDTTEEPLTPTEIEQPILNKENIKPLRAEIKTYAEIISETPAEICEKRESQLWKESVIQMSSPQALSATFLLKESLGYSAKPQYQGTQTMQAAKIIIDRVKNLQNTNELNHLGNILHIAHLEEVTTERLAEERSSDVRRELAQLKNAVQENDVIVVEETLVTVVETISTWLETIEYRIFLNRECPTGPSHEDARTFIELKDEVNNVEESVRELDDIWKQLEPNYSKEEREKLRECVDALEHQVKIIEHVTIDGEKHANRQLARWDEFLNSINNVYRLIEEQRKQLDYIIESEYSTQWKLQELDKLDNTNRCHMWKTSSLLDAARELLRDHPSKIIPEETYAAHEMTKIIEHSICIERERLLQLLALAEEYEQTLQEFAQIIEIAENLLDSPISAVSLEHLQEEMQKHRKFFVNLNHCRAILESLEGNLDPETRAKHSGLHEELHSKATALLDQAASRAQQMALAASRWMLLEQGVKEERGWLQVAHQRVPDLQTVTSTDYDQYISLYQSLSSDVATHHARLIHLLSVACSLRDLINIEDPEDRYSEALDVIVKLQDNIESSLKRLLAFRENWNNQEILTNRVEHWITMAEKELTTLHDPSGSSMRQFWELKAQYEVHNNMRNEADIYFEQALRIIPLSDEMLQRQFHYELQGRWNEISDKINEIQKDVTRSISSEEISSNKKLKLLERELNELRTTINSFHGVLKTEEELDLYVERLTILFDRISLIQNEIGRLGLLPAAESERVGILLTSARCIEGQISEELDSAQLLKEKIQALQHGLSRFRKAHKRLSIILDQCEGSERQESNLVAAAVDRCQSVANELAVLWQNLMALRQMLHNLPTGMRVTVSPVSIERDLSNIQDVHTELESRCAHLLSLLTNRLELWRRFERQLEMVQQSVQEADYMMELLTVQDSVDYDRLLKATERLEKDVRVVSCTSLLQQKNSIVIVTDTRFLQFNPEDWLFPRNC